MKAITADEMKQLESFAIDCGIPARSLMEMAGMKLASISAHEVKKASRAVIVCGSGGNGGDGLVAARYLHNQGIKADVFLTAKIKDLTSADAIENLKVLDKLGIAVNELELNNLHSLKMCLLESDIVIDSIYGIGFHGSIMPEMLPLFLMINTARNSIVNKRPYVIISADTPSGVDVTTGNAATGCINADITVTFEYPKLGLLKYPASQFAGKIVTTSIGIPKPNPIDRSYAHIKGHSSAPEKRMQGINVIDAEHVSRLLPRFRSDINKGDRGKVLVIAGSSGMLGAAVMTSRSALRSGCGLVTMSVPDELVDLANTMSMETVTKGFGAIDSVIGDANSVAIGPGLGTKSDVHKLLDLILTSKDCKCPIVIDADALNMIKSPSILKRSRNPIVITPHPGEFARLTGDSIDTIQKDRIKKAGDFAVKYNVVVVLKGAYTVIVSPELDVHINPLANSAMATAGSGDVLTGMIAGFIGQGLRPYDAAIAGVYAHGLAGNVASSLKGGSGIIAGDIIDAIPYAVESLR